MIKVAPVLAVALLAGSCASSDGDSEPGSTTPVVTQAPVTSEQDQVATTPAPAEATTSLPTTTLSLDDRVSAACDTLANSGFETRVAAVSDPDVLAAVESACPEPLARLIAAQGVLATTASIDAADPAVELSSVRCGEGTYSFIATNQIDVPIGVHLAFRVFVGDDTEPSRSGDYPLVIWRLEPGEAQGINGEYDAPEAEHRCNLSARVFNADDSEADASLASPSAPELAADEPAAWFGNLLTREAQAVGSQDPDAASITEDLRSVAYEDVLADTSGQEPPARIPTSVTVCNLAQDQPSPERLSLVYYVTYPTDDGIGSESFLRHGLFRRGADDQWRWLSSPQYFNSEDFWGCGVPTD